MIRTIWAVVLLGFALFVYPSVAVWLSDRIPYVYWLLMPWSTPLPSALAIALAIGAWFLRRGGNLSRPIRAAIIVAAACLTLVWLSFFAYLAWIQLKGGL